MRQSLLIVLLIVIIFTGTWFLLASIPGTFLDEGDHLDWGYGMAQTGSIHYRWDFDLNQPVYMDLKYGRSLIFTYLCSLAFKLPGDPLLWCRSIPLFFTFLTFLILAFYYHRRGILTGQRLLILAILYFSSSLVLDISYFTRTYAMLGTAVTIAFILYWEGLMLLRGNNMTKAMLLWAIGFILISVSVIDQWQLEGVPALAIGIVVSIAAFNLKVSPLAAWIKKRSWWFLIGAMLVSPLAICSLKFVSWYKIGGYAPFTLQYHSSFWDNCIGWLRFISAINIGLLALGWAFKTKLPLSFDRWMFVTGFLTGILCILYNPDDPIFNTKYVFLPALIMIIGLSGVLEDYFKKSSLRKSMLAVYVVINMGVSVCYALEHNNVKSAIQWLNTHLSQEDILLADDKVGDSLQFCGGHKLLLRRYLITASTDRKDILELRKYIYDRPRGRIFYLYCNGNSVRAWLCKFTIGKDLDPPLDLWSHLRIKVPSNTVIPGLRQCGLLEFDHAVLLIALDHLLKYGFNPKPHFTARDLFHHFIK